MATRIPQEITGNMLSSLASSEPLEPVIDNTKPLKELNPRQKLCLEKIAQGFSHVDSAKMAGYSCNDNYSSSATISRLVKSPEGKAYLDSIRRPSVNEAKDIQGIIVQTYMNQALFNIKNILESENYDIVVDKESQIKITRTNFFLKKKLSEFTDAELAGVTGLSCKNGSVDVKWDRHDALQNLSEIIGLKEITEIQDIEQAFINAKLPNTWGGVDA